MYIFFFSCGISFREVYEATLEQVAGDDSVGLENTEQLTDSGIFHTGMNGNILYHYASFFADFKQNPTHL